jgi:hypothetical protein
MPPNQPVPPPPPAPHVLPPLPSILLAEVRRAREEAETVLAALCRLESLLADLVAQSAAAHVLRPVSPPAPPRR